MDLLCTENIMNVNENEIVCSKQMQEQEELQQRKLERVLQYQPAIAQQISAVYVNPSPTQLGANLTTNIPLEYGYTSVCETTKCVECCQSQSAKCIGNHASATAAVACVTDVCTVSDTTAAVQTDQVTTNSYQEEVYSTNLINRTIDYVNTATEDPTFLTDRCLENALKAEEKRPQSVCTYFVTVQQDITPPMRKIVAEWMMETIE
ncbi:uncharacterized protein LOC119666208 [Teleopsis dalmanni]|uniref:uncharacterized protein LOC119666208 n=1 Tax=Teleopsis dalmanni TaxID=139649 RepID=UPI0018CD8A97|nr:uncharacterized protein LOC119666208 [Teleopsis dalmanni]